MSISIFSVVYNLHICTTTGYVVVISAYICTFKLKVIDSLHIKNHKDEKCHQLYHPDKVHKINENINLMCAEQTFVWLSRYKRIMCSMNKTHHLFFLHRLIVLRNEYTKMCHDVGRKPLLPKAKNKAVNS